mmetsp:Transcript_35003/g.110085  ORF Transcript_35003/g.110085 Transcript_35003/m.110085 type:complete len:379 (-) Transcript_35003:1000-2136(-)
MKRSLSPSAKRIHRRSRSDSSMLPTSTSRRGSGEKRGSTDSLAGFEAGDLLSFAEDDFSLDYFDPTTAGGDTYIQLGGPGQPSPMLTFETLESIQEKHELPDTSRRRSSSGNSGYNLFGPALSSSEATEAAQAASGSTSVPKGHRRAQSEPPESLKFGHMDSLDDFDMGLNATTELTSADSESFGNTPKSFKGAESFLLPSKRAPLLKTEDSNDGTEDGRRHLSSSDFGPSFNRGSANSADWDEILTTEKDGLTLSRMELPPAPAAVDVFGEASPSLAETPSNGVSSLRVSRGVVQSGETTTLTLTLTLTITLTRTLTSWCARDSRLRVAERLQCAWVLRRCRVTRPWPRPEGQDGACAAQRRAAAAEHDARDGRHVC